MTAIRELQLDGCHCRARSASRSEWKSHRGSKLQAEPDEAKIQRVGTVLVGALGSFWRAQTAGWLFGALFAVVSRILAFEDVAFAFALTAVLEPLGFALTTLAYRIFRHRIGGVTLTVVAVALALSIAGGVLQMLIANAMKDVLQPNIDPDYGANGSVIPAIYYTLIFLGWSLAYLWIKADADAESNGCGATGLVRRRCGPSFTSCACNSIHTSCSTC